MKHSYLIPIIFALAPVALSLPARADQAVVNDSVQTAIVTGHNNTVVQNNNTSIRSDDRSGNSGTSVRNRQTADVAGNDNNVYQDNRTEIRSRQRSR